MTWSDAAPVPVGFQNITIINNGDVRQAWQIISQSDYVVVLTSFNVRMLARLGLDILSKNPKPLMIIVQTSAHSDPTARSVSQQSYWLSSLINLSSVTVCASAVVEASIRQHLSDIASTVRILTIENGARLTDDRKHRRKRQHLSFIGRPTVAKGFDLFMRLAKDLNDTELIFSANTVSIPPPVKDPRIQWSWGLDDLQLKTFFATTDLLAVPYRSADGLPLAVLEAINCGVPILASDSPAVRPLLRRYGQVVVPAGYEPLKKAVIDWHSQQLSWRAPVPGSVNSLSEQVATYIDLVAQGLLHQK